MSKKVDIKLAMDRYKRSILDIDEAYEEVQTIVRKDVSTAFILGILLGAVITYIIIDII